MSLKAFRTSANEIVRVVGNSRADKIVINLSKSKKSKNFKFKILMQIKSKF